MKKATMPEYSALPNSHSGFWSAKEGADKDYVWLWREEGNDVHTPAQIHRSEMRDIINVLRKMESGRLPGVPQETDGG